MVEQIKSNRQHIRKTFVGTVIRDKMQKTRVVEVARLVQHPMLKKVMRIRSRFVAHDEHNASHVGDLVKIVETRPLSRTKRWWLAKILKRAEVTA